MAKISPTNSDLISNTASGTNEIKFFWVFIFAEIAVAILLRILVFIHYGELFINDSYIFLRYADNMASGNGLVYNIGEKILGYSSPLYVILLSGLRFITMNLPFNVVVFITNLLLFTVSSIIVALLVKKHGLLGFIFITLFCFYFPYVDATVDGMGTILMMTIVLLALYAYSRNNLTLTYILATLSLVMRPEGGLLIASVVFGSLFIKKTKPSVKTLIICLLILMAWLIPTYLYFGQVLPDSMMSKSTLFTGQQWGGIQSHFFEKAIMLMFGFSDNTYFDFGLHIKMVLWIISIGAAILFVFGFIKSIKKSLSVSVAAIFFILLIIFYSVGSPVRMFSWYTIVPSVIFLFVAIRGTEYLLQSKKIVWASSVGLVVVFIVSIMSIISGLPGRAESINREVAKVEKLINYLDEVAPDVHSIMISDIGYVGYWKDWRIIDGSGLISPQVLLHRNGENLSYLSDIFSREKPDIIYFKVDIMHNPVIDENMRYATFRDSVDRADFVNNYKEISKAEDFAEIFVRKSLLLNQNPAMLK